MRRRVQLFQNWPEIIPSVVPFAKPPFYANSDDQTLLNDAIVSAVRRAPRPPPAAAPHATRARRPR